MNAATSKELDTFYGVEVSAMEWTLARERQTAAYDQDDLVEVAYEKADEILAALAASDMSKVGEIFAIARAMTIARRVSVEILGQPN